MKRALRSGIGIILLAGSLSMAGAAAVVLAAAPQSTTRVIPPAESVTAASNALSISNIAFDCDYLPLDADTLPEDATLVDGSVLARNMRHPQPTVWKPP
jgi:hypothetical protein